MLISVSSFLFAYSLIVTVLWARARGRIRRAFADLDVMRHDPVSGVLTRRPWLERAHHLMGSWERPAVAWCDLNGFKQFNDRHTHADGDVVLCQFAQRLRAEFGPHALIGRFGGDEFVVLVDAASTGDDALEVAARACVVHWRGMACGAAFGIARAADLAPIPGGVTRRAAHLAARRNLGRIVHAADLASKRAKLRCHAEHTVTDVEFYDPRTYTVPIQLCSRPRVRARDS